MFMDMDQIKTEIIRRHGTLKSFAEKHNIGPTLLSRWLTMEKPTEKFKAILETEGIELNSKKSDMINSEREIENYAVIVKELKSVIYEKNKLINEQNVLLNRKDKMLDQYEKYIEIHKERI